MTLEWVTAPLLLEREGRRGVTVLFPLRCWMLEIFHNHVFKINRN